jgi:hypothetical protein
MKTFVRRGWNYTLHHRFPLSTLPDTKFLAEPDCVGKIYCYVKIQKSCAISI